ncbi:iron uptake transporter deferrochelatase/peroxidase subunit [Glutamicibacter endophyticus]|uniref:iron uptake transporter deferrochelatase/peroxidase subunit n=1 Tax=Glutamicibacter endophyticus TaxID=1522174 RepID=UPI003AF196CA
MGQQEPQRSGMSRRNLLTAAGTGGAGLALGALGYAALGRQPADASTTKEAVVDCFGEHQAGITTAAQERMHLAVFDVTATDRAELVDLLTKWSTAIASLTRGEPIGAGGALNGGYDAPPEDTGEALDLSAANLTVTVGFGRSLFVDAEGRDRFGLRAKLPEALIELPHFAGDMLESQRTGGDIVVQACADDPQVAVHAIRNLARIGFGAVRVRSSQIGFGRTAKTTTSQRTPRNLFGFKDGTANILAEDHQALNEHVWVADGDQPWLEGGTYMVTRRIRMHIETWDRSPLGEQEQIVGRTKGTGAPLSGGDEFSAPDFSLQGSNGPLIPADSHVAVVHPQQHDGARILRRGFNYTDGSDDLGRLDAGLFFIAFLRDARTHFVPLQRAMSARDAMTEYLRTNGSGLFAIPPGFGQGGYLGQQLFES